MTKKGKPCRATATEGGLCFFSRQSQQGHGTGPDWGRKNGQIRVGLDPLPNLDNAMAIREAVARLISDVYAGKLHPRIAAALAPLMRQPTAPGA